MKGILLGLILVMVMGCAYYTAIKINFIHLEAIHTIHTMDVVLVNGEVTSKKRASGAAFSIKDGLILATTHAVIKENLYSPSFYIGDTEIEFVGAVGDVAVFRHPNPPKAHFILGTPPEVGVEVVIVGNSMLRGVNVKRGDVSMLGTGGFEVEERCFVHTAPLVPGDSGSPILARRGQKYEVVGMANAGVLAVQGYNFAICVSYLKEVIDVILSE